MADNEANLKPKKSAAADGFSGPIADDGKVPDHINPDTLMAKGIDPDAGMVTVNLQALTKLHGEKKAKEIYRKVAVAGGFFDPNAEPSGSDFAPDLSLEGMNKDAREKVNAILEGK